MGSLPESPTHLHSDTYTQRVYLVSDSRETKLNPTASFPAPSPDLPILVNAGAISQHAQTQSYFWLAPFSHSYLSPRVLVSQVHSFSSFSVTSLLVPVPIIPGCCQIHPHLTWVFNPNLTLLKIILHFTDRLHHAVVHQLSHLLELCIVCRVNRMASALHDPIYLSDLISHSSLTGILSFSHQFVYPYTLGYTFCLPIIGPTLSPTYQNGRVLILPE